MVWTTPEVTGAAPVVTIETKPVQTNQTVSDDTVVVVDGDDVLDRSIYELVIAMGGSISAEHGIGTAKSAYLPMQRSAAELNVMRGLKAVCDPNGILNPSVIFDQ